MMSPSLPQDGFTLPELLVTLAIALIVSLATFSLIDIVMSRSGEIGARVDTTQRGRTAMDQITRQLRSQVCAWRATTRHEAARSIDAAAPDVGGRFADFTNESLSAASSPAPDLRTLSPGRPTTLHRDGRSRAVAGDDRERSATRATADVAPVPDQRRRRRFADAPTRRSRSSSATTVPTTGTPPPAGAARRGDRQGATGALTATSRAVAKITSASACSPREATTNGSTVLQNDVYVRTADPNARPRSPHA